MGFAVRAAPRWQKVRARFLEFYHPPCWRAQPTPPQGHHSPWFIWAFAADCVRMPHPAPPQALAVVVIVGVNLTVKLLVQRISLREKHHTRSKETRSITGALATTQVLNFAVSVVVANAYLPRAQVRWRTELRQRAVPRG